MLRQELQKLAGDRPEVWVVIRIGIASGELVTGTLGSDTRRSLMECMDLVNLASRLVDKSISFGALVFLDATPSGPLQGIERLQRFGSVFSAVWPNLSSWLEKI
jgi:hypothetical protein